MDPWAWIAVVLAELVLIALLWRYFAQREAQLRGRADSARSALAALAGETPGDDEPQEAGTYEDPPELLVQACAAGECVLFIGTGAGRPLELPTWREALLEVLARCRSREPEEHTWARLAEQVRTEDYDLLAELLEERLGRFQLLERLREVVGKPLGSADALYRDLRRIPFSGVLANTWTDMASAVLGRGDRQYLDPADDRRLTAALRSRDAFVLDIYGRLDDDSLILTADAFRAVLDQNPAYARFLSFVLTTRSIFFFGAGVAGIERAFEALPSRAPGTRPHFALVPASAEAELRRERLKSRFNVHLLTYEATTRHQPEARAFCAALAAEVGKRGSVAAKAERRLSPLTGVSLRNVGPFEALDLALEQGWNLVLGNNACGKSTVLRAIALALCGDDDRAAAAAGRVLKAGAGEGSIELRFGEDVFRTRLVRDGARIRVNPDNVSPVQAGLYRAMAFPPLRGASTRAPKPPTERSSPEPLVDAVLPMVTGVADERIDDIKQWIVNEFWARQGPSPFGGASRRFAKAPASVNRFFATASRLTPGVSYRFEELDPRTLEVMVRTADGVVPIELLSQGIGSVLSWTGPLITALEGEGTLPTIVLVDEIDAHLHPLWQKRLVPALRDEFPDVQFIATTHSPLVVGSVKDGALWALHRPAEGPIQQERIEPRYAGWRADQILTSRAFGLDVARDQETEDQIRAYLEFRSQHGRSPRQRKEADDRARRLAAQLPAPEETPTKMDAATAVREWLAREARPSSVEETDRLIEEAEAYLAKIRRESR